MFTSEAVGMRVDAPRLHWHLLGMRPIFVRNGSRTKAVLRVHEPLFGDVDLLVIEDATRRLDILVNPWIPAEHRATVLASPLYRGAQKKRDPLALLEVGAAWSAPSEAEARALTHQHLAGLNTNKDPSRFDDPRQRREFEVMCALAEIHGDHVGGFLNVVSGEIAIKVD